MSAITVAVPASKRYPQRIGTQLKWAGKITGTGSYATGGDTLSPKLLGMNVIEGGYVAPSAGFVFELIPQADGTAKVKAFWTGAVVSTALGEVTAAQSLAAATPQVEIIGH